MHCFEGVTSIIFYVALSEYDQVSFQDLDKVRPGQLSLLRRVGEPLSHNISLISSLLV